MYEVTKILMNIYYKFIFGELLKILKYFKHNCCYGHFEFDTLLQSTFPNFIYLYISIYY